MLYSEISDPLNSTCSITQEDFNANDHVCVINNCGHIFLKMHYIIGIKDIIVVQIVVIIF